MAVLEEGGMFDEDTMPDWMKTMRGVAINPRPLNTNPTLPSAPSPANVPPPVSFSEILPPPGLPPGKCID